MKTTITFVFVLAASAAMMAAPKGGASSSSCKAWNDTFQSLDTTRWTVSSGSAPGSNSVNTSSYDPHYVQLVAPGVLQLALTQVATGATVNGVPAVNSYGSSIRTKKTCGYGTYQWTMKMSSSAMCASCSGSAVSGSVSAGFIYVNNSQTEIDFEFEGKDANTLYLVNWLNTNTQLDPPPSSETLTPYTFNTIDAQHVYKFVWTAGKISYYVDGILVANHTTNVPTAPAYFIINHWGTNSTNWGGLATTGVARNMYVTQASFTPSK